MRNSIRKNNEFTPYIPPDKSVLEFTLRAILLGVVLTIIMAAANTYLGLYAGMTVSASIPAAVISMGILRGLMRRGTILENNIVQTISSAGESLAAGIIFTIPALVIAGVWQKFNYWTTTLVALLGGLLGVILMVPLRRSLIVEEKSLIYPEGLACGEVLEAGEKRGTGILYVFSALGLGVVFKFLVSGVSVIKSAVEGAIRVGRTAIYGGSDMSVALIGVGYIVGFNIALLVFIGGAIGWIIGIPIYGIVRGFPAHETLVDAFSDVWSTQIRYMGVGAMIVGGIWSIIKVRHGIVKGLKNAILGYKRGMEAVRVKRTDQDLPGKQVMLALIAVAIPIFILYAVLTRSTSIGIVSGMAMIIMAFFFVAVSSYIVGLVGSSNNPISGMTICTLLFVTVLLLLFKMTGTAGMLAALGVAGVVCCAAATAGDISQDLKTGYIVGATPRRQQLAQMIGAIAPAFILAPILTMLHKAYGIGTGEPGALTAPQASLFASITSAMFTDRALPWTMVGIGAGIGITLICIDELLRSRGSAFRAHVMPVAVGIYLPLVLSVPILIGGLVSLGVKKITTKRGTAKEATHRGILFSSGLIAGEAVMGIIIAALILPRIRGLMSIAILQMLWTGAIIWIIAKLVQIEKVSFGKCVAVAAFLVVTCLALLQALPLIPGMGSLLVNTLSMLIPICATIFIIKIMLNIELSKILLIWIVALGAAFVSGVFSPIWPGIISVIQSRIEAVTLPMTVFENNLVSILALAAVLFLLAFVAIRGKKENSNSISSAPST